MSSEQQVISELTNVSFATFIRNGVVSWLKRRDEAFQLLESLEEQSLGVESEIEKLQELVLPLDDEESLVEDNPDSEALAEQLEKLEEESEEVRDKVAEITYDPNLIPTSGRDAAGKMVMPNKLWFESKCVIIALWVRQSRRSEELFIADDSLPTITRLLQDLLYRCDNPNKQRHFARCFESQLEAIDHIADDLLTAFPTQNIEIDYLSTAQEIETALSSDDAIRRNMWYAYDQNVPDLFPSGADKQPANLRLQQHSKLEDYVARFEKLISEVKPDEPTEKGVGIIDVAEFAINKGWERDIKVPSRLAKRWTDRCKSERPQKLGFHPNFKTRPIYKPSDAIKFCQKFLNLDVDERQALRQYLSGVAVLPLPEIVGNSRQPSSG